MIKCFSENHRGDPYFNFLELTFCMRSESNPSRNFVTERDTTNLNTIIVTDIDEIMAHVNDRDEDNDFLEGTTCGVYNNYTEIRYED